MKQKKPVKVTLSTARKLIKQEEIKTISKRPLELELSDADIIRLAEKAGSCGLTVSELLQNFIGDLVDGTHSNGSDERMYAQEWFNRCWFGSFPDYTFLRHLIEWSGRVKSVLDLWDDIQSGKGEIADIEAHPEEYGSDEKAAIQEDIDYWQEEINGYWNEYIEQKMEYKHGTFDEEMEKILAWRQECQCLLKE